MFNYQKILRIKPALAKVLFHRNHIAMNYNRDARHVSKSEIRRFIVDCMKSVGTVDNHSALLADNLISADHRGHFSHGLHRLEMYMKDIESGLTSNEDIFPTIVKETAATALVDGNNLLGVVVGDFCMKLAIEKCRESGIGWVSANNSNHFGICAYYSSQASRQGFVGMSMTNSSPITAPTRAKKAGLGTNPISVTAPVAAGNDFDLDMALSSVALGKCEIAKTCKSNIPRGWGITRDGKDTTDPTEVLDNGSLLPLGSSEDTSSYKGYGLIMAIEILSSVLSGAAVGPQVRHWKTCDIKANLGQTFIALDPSSFAGGFSERLSELMDTCRNLEPIEPNKKVLVAGDPERLHMKECDEAGGIPYHDNHLALLNALGEKYSVTPLRVFHPKRG